MLGGGSHRMLSLRSSEERAQPHAPPMRDLLPPFLLVQGKEMFLDLLDNVRRNTVYSLQMYNPSPKPAAGP